MGALSTCHRLHFLKFNLLSEKFPHLSVNFNQVFFCSAVKGQSGINLQRLLILGRAADINLEGLILIYRDCWYQLGDSKLEGLSEKISHLCSHLQSAPSSTCHHSHFSPLNSESPFSPAEIVWNTELAFKIRHLPWPQIQFYVHWRIKRLPEKWHNITRTC